MMLAAEAYQVLYIDDSVEQQRFPKQVFEVFMANKSPLFKGSNPLEN